MRHIRPFGLLLLCIVLAAFTTIPSLPQASTRHKKMSPDYNINSFTPATAICADLEKILASSPPAVMFILSQIDGYSAGQQRIDLAVFVANASPKDGCDPTLPVQDLFAACEAAPQQPLLPLWRKITRDWRPRNAEQSNCAELLRDLANTDSGQDKDEHALAFLAWLHGYTRLGHGGPRMGLFNSDALRDALTVCALRPRRLIRDVLPPVSRSLPLPPACMKTDEAAAHRVASDFDPVSATCADWLSLDGDQPLKYGDTTRLDAMENALIQVDGYASALDGVPLPSALESKRHIRDRLKNICMAQPRKRLITLWRILRPLTLKADQTTCADWLAPSRSGDSLRDLFSLFWLYGYNQAESGVPGSLFALTGDPDRVFEHALDAVCARRPKALLRDALRDMERQW